MRVPEGLLRRQGHQSDRAIARGPPAGGEEWQDRAQHGRRHQLPVRVHHVPGPQGGCDRQPEDGVMTVISAPSID